MKVWALTLTIAIAAWGTTTVAFADDALTPLDLRGIKVGGEIGRRIDVTVNNNLLVLDVDKEFLQPFHTKTATSGYVGLGKLIDATVRLAAYTNQDKVLALKKHLVDKAIETQEPDGYIGMMAPAGRMSGMWDIHEMGYIVNGLVSDYQFFKEERSLAAAKKLADYIVSHWKNLPEDWEKQTHIDTDVSVIGLERAMLALYRTTGDQKYLDFCMKQRRLPEWDQKIVIGRREGIEGHIYGYLGRCLSQAEGYRSLPDDRLLRSTRRALRFMTEQDGAMITGATGEFEIWTDDQDGRNDLGETCATAYQLRLYDSLLRLEGNPRYGDLIERTIYNTLFAAQSPDGRRIRYYSPVEGARQYFQHDTWCCPNNYRRIVAELPTMVYYRSGPGVAVNLYTPSEATVELAAGASVKIQQETDYPSSGRVAIQVDPTRPTRFPLRLRIPRWCKEAAVSVNGQPWSEAAVPGEFLSIDRQWTAGDRVTLDMPMPWRLVQGRKRQSGRAAVMRGPMVFCLNPAQNPGLAQKDAADLGYIMIDPDSLKALPEVHEVRPNGVVCSVRAGNDPFAIGVSGNLSLRLTEFADPDGKAVYFRLPDFDKAVPDELFSGDCGERPAAR